MRKPNYHQAKKQKELSRKARQQEKQQKRVVVRPEADGVSPQAARPTDRHRPRMIQTLVAGA